MSATWSALDILPIELWNLILSLPESFVETIGIQRTSTSKSTGGDATRLAVAEPINWLGPELTPFVDHATIHKPATPFAFNLAADMDGDWTVSNDFISDAESPYAPGSSSSLVESVPPFPLPISLSDEELLAAFAAAAPPESWDTHTENGFASEFYSAPSDAPMNSESTYSGFYPETGDNSVLLEADIGRTSGLGLSFDGEPEDTQDASVDIDLDAIMGFGADMFPSVDDPTGTGFLQSFTDFASSTAAGHPVDSWGY
ncbi:HMG box domain-containing protein [Mycena chlorophos]|uniref:HMG box domain-containing protein n=1 Tax=Mycena chlorophos TaxID=658473 RepID=A0A8H6VW97_MYCCL|nr:HMG box domain-containing protein [Mycena chlorophos]